MPDSTTLILNQRSVPDHQEWPCCGCYPCLASLHWMEQILHQDPRPSNLKPRSAHSPDTKFSMKSQCPLSVSLEKRTCRAPKIRGILMGRKWITAFGDVYWHLLFYGNCHFAQIHSKDAIEMIATTNPYTLNPTSSNLAENQTNDFFTTLGGVPKIRGTFWGAL